MLKITTRGSLLTGLLVLASGTAVAHDPVFGLGPHVLFKGGVEIAPQVHTSKQGDKEQTELGLEMTYGITGDWAAGVELPYAYNDDGTNKSDGVADVNLFTKYRFWRNDKLGSQETAAIMAKVITDTGADDKTPPLGSGTTDGILGLTYGYEARKWYRWASVRYRFNDTNDAGIDRGDMIKLDFVGGIRPTPTGYLEPDTVWLLELNGEYGMRSSLNGTDLLDTGGTQWFISPGIFWTKRNFAIKAGVQIPIVSNLNGKQEDTDYRAKIVFEWHL